MKKTFLIIAFLTIMSVPALALASFDDCVNNAGTSSQLCNPLVASTEQQALTYAVNFVAVALVGFTVTYVVFAGFRMIIAQGNSEALETAKTGLQWSLLGLVLVLLAYVIIAATQHYIGIKPDISPTAGTLQNPLLSNTFAELIGMMMSGMMKLAGTIALLMILISGFRYLSAGANEEQAEQAKTSLQWSVIGLAIILLAYVIVVATATLFTTVTP